MKLNFKDTFHKKDPATKKEIYFTKIKKLDQFVIVGNELYSTEEMLGRFELFPFYDHAFIIQNDSGDEIWFQKVTKKIKVYDKNIALKSGLLTFNELTNLGLSFMDINVVPVGVTFQNHKDNPYYGEPIYDVSQTPEFRKNGLTGIFNIKDNHKNIGIVRGDSLYVHFDSLKNEDKRREYLEETSFNLKPAIKHIVLVGNIEDRMGEYIYNTEKKLMKIKLYDFK